MRFIVLCFSACVLTVVGQDIDAMRNMPKYDSRYDYLDVDALFNSKRLVRNYVDCLINSRRCTPEGKALKNQAPVGIDRLGRAVGAIGPSHIGINQRGLIPEFYFIPPKMVKDRNSATRDVSCADVMFFKNALGHSDPLSEAGSEQAPISATSSSASVPPVIEGSLQDRTILRSDKKISKHCTLTAWYIY